jgi:hypothetical protein
MRVKQLDSDPWYQSIYAFRNIPRFSLQSNGIDYEASRDITVDLKMRPGKEDSCKDW